MGRAVGQGELVNALAGSVPFLRLAGTALGGWLLARARWWRRASSPAATAIRPSSRPS
jgi:hypothetical protein